METLQSEIRFMEKQLDHLRVTTQEIIEMSPASGPVVQEKMEVGLFLPVLA